MNSADISDSDENLVARARQGDESALTALFRRYEKRAYNIALRMLGDPWDAADVTQEAFIKAFTSLDQFRGEAQFGTWLYRIVVNATHDHLRKRHLEPLDREELDRVTSAADAQAQARLVGAVQSPTDPSTDGLSPPILQALSELDERFRLAVVLCDLLGFDYAEAAQILDVREGTIKSRIFRARAELARRLKELGFGPSVPAKQERKNVSASGQDTGTAEKNYPS